jgi:hypothetical protein
MSASTAPAPNVRPTAKSHEPTYSVALRGLAKNSAATTHSPATMTAKMPRN